MSLMGWDEPPCNYCGGEHSVTRCPQIPKAQKVKTMREPKLTKFQKCQSILNLVNSWVQLAYRDVIDAEASLASQKVVVAMENARWKDDPGFYIGQGKTTEYQEKRVAETNAELERRQEIQAFAIEKFLKEEDEL